MRALVKNGLIAAAGLVASVALGRISAPIWLLFLTVVVFLVVAVFLKWFLASKGRKYLLGGVALVYCLILGFGMWTVLDDVSVTVNCAPIRIPLSGNQGGSLYAIYLDPKWGDRLVSASSVSWPTWATSNDGAYRCEVINNGVSVLHGLSLIFMVTFRESSGLPDTRSISITSPVSLEPKHAVAFHIADDTRSAVEVTPPSNATVRVGNDAEARTIPARYSTVDGHPVRLRGFNP